jgi:protein TonB
MIVASLVLHIGLAIGALKYSKDTRQKRRATAVAVVNKAKESKPKPKVEEKPKPKVEKPKVEEKPKTEVASAKDLTRPAPTSRSAETAPPVDSNLTFDNTNDGPGIPVLPPTKKGPSPQQQKSAVEPDKRTEKQQKREKAEFNAQQKAAEEDTCTEAPSKPVVLTRSTDIEYTQDARANGIEGRLILKIVVGADGSVEKVDVVSSVDPSLDAAAIAAVKTWTFKPAMRCGKPMGGAVFTLARRFELGD